MGIDELEYGSYLEQSVVVLLRNNRYLYGTLKSFDQYNSITLNYVTERIFCKGRYSEKKQGLVILRGENIVLIGISDIPVLKNCKKVNYEALLKELDENKNITTRIVS